MARSGLWLDRMHLKFHLLSLLLATNPTIILVPKELVAWWVKHHSLRLHVLFNRKNNNNNPSTTAATQPPPPSSPISSGHDSIKFLKRYIDWHIKRSSSKIEFFQDAFVILLIQGYEYS